MYFRKLLKCFCLRGSLAYFAPLPELRPGRQRCIPRYPPLRWVYAAGLPISTRPAWVFFWHRSCILPQTNALLQGGRLHPRVAFHSFAL